jgi:uracil-DNA glycosylase
MTSDHATASTFLPARLTPGSLERAARVCTGCDLHHLGTQTVFGEGPVPAALMLVGEQPGDREDREGRPFVGPAGALLDRALTEAGVDRDEVYLTNAVKHCPVGGHAREAPAPSEAVDGPDRRLPAVAGRGDLDRPPRDPGLPRRDGRTGDPRAFVPPDPAPRELLDAEEVQPRVVATVHPASILRATDDRTREEQRSAFVDDVARAASARRAMHAHDGGG